MLETIFGESEGGKGQLAATEIDEQKFLRAKRGLIGEGIDADTAEINLRKLAEVVVAITNAERPGDLSLRETVDQYHPPNEFVLFHREHPWILQCDVSDIPFGKAHRTGTTSVGRGVAQLPARVNWGLGFIPSGRSLAVSVIANGTKSASPALPALPGVLAMPACDYQR